MKTFLASFLFLLLQLSVAQDSVTVIPNSDYQSGSLHRFFFGEHWRSLWASPLTVPVIDPDRFDGGLVPTERGGGFQTLSLRFLSANGKDWKFRSLDKFPAKLLPDELQETFVEEIVQDQISWSHPMSAVIAAPFLDAVGLLHAPAQLVALPHSELLGIHRETFGGMLGTLEENPNDDGPVVFGGAEKIKSTYSLFRELLEENDESVDAHEYLKARLVDIVIGDWDRHVDQWKWAGYSRNGKRIWRPIPRDRDQAFAKIDGVLPWFVAYSVKQIESYETVFPLIEDLTWSGRHLDRKFLPVLTRRAWDSITVIVQSAITDSVISAAVRRMPDTWFRSVGVSMIAKIRERRDALRDVSEEFYRHIIRYADVRMSDKDEHAEVRRIDDSSVYVTVWKRDKSTGGPKGDPVFHRRFSVDETEEIRLLMFGGDDAVSVLGNVSTSIDLHIDGGEGKDDYNDESEVHGYLFSILPVPSAETKTFFYDSGKKSTFTAGKSTSVITQTFDPPEDDTVRFEPYRDDGRDFRPLVVARYASSDGFLLGFGQTMFTYGFRYDPFRSRVDASGVYSTGHEAFQGDLLGDFRTLNKHLTFRVHLRFSGIEVLRYFGSGNEVPLSVDPDNEKYYQIRQRLYFFEPSAEYRMSPSLLFFGGLSLKRSTLRSDSSYITMSAPYGTAALTFAGLHAGLVLDTRDHPVFPREGFFFRSRVSAFPSVLDNRSAFTKASADLRWFVTPWGDRSPTFAGRLFGEKLWGRFPFFESATLGGTESVRGFETQRFAGNGALSAHAESRFFITKARLLIPITIGGLMFVETGRVFAAGERSTRWHSGAGAGLWFSVIERELTFSISVARSREQMEAHFTTGFSF